MICADGAQCIAIVRGYVMDAHAIIAKIYHANPRRLKHRMEDGESSKAILREANLHVARHVMVAISMRQPIIARTAARRWRCRESDGQV